MKSTRYRAPDSSASSAMPSSMVKVSNDLLNTSVISSVGKVFNAVGLTPIHQLADTLGYGVFKGVAAVGGLLGGDTSRIDYHYDTEWT